MGHATSKPERHPYPRVLRALLWGGLVAVHTPGLIASWDVCLHHGVDAARLSGCLGLSVAMVFFILKLWNMEFLRFDTSPKSLVLIAVAVVLLHGNALQRGLDGAVVSKDAPIAATTLMSLGLRRVQRAAVAAVSRASERIRQCILALLTCNSSTTETRVLRRWILAARLCTPRAPPA